MTLWRRFPTLRPRHSVHAVLRQLIEGLENGSIVLEKNLPSEKRNIVKKQGEPFAAADRPRE
jgi:hypothetical protein